MSTAERFAIAVRTDPTVTAFFHYMSKGDGYQTFPRPKWSDGRHTPPKTWATREGAEGYLDRHPEFGGVAEVVAVRVAADGSVTIIEEATR